MTTMAARIKKSLSQNAKTFGLTVAAWAACVLAFVLSRDVRYKHFPNAYAAEMIQLVVSLAALAFCLWCVHDAYLDARALKRAHVNGARGNIAAGNVRTEICKAIILIAFIFMGAFAITHPPPDDIREADTRHEKPEQIAITVNRSGLVFVTFVLLWDSIRERRGRLLHVRSMKEKRYTPDAHGRSAWAPPPGRSDRAEDYPKPPFDKPTEDQ